MNYHYNIGCSLNNLKGVRGFIRQSLEGQEMSDLELGAIILALDEMCSNLMIHNHHCNPDHFIALNIHIPAKGQFIFEFVDDVSMFDISLFQEPKLDNLIHEKRKGGLGIRLIKSIMDKIEYVHEGGKNVCRLTKTI